MQDLLNLYAPISLEDMREIRLMNRIDTKFVTTVPVLLQLLEMAKDDYWAQEIDGERNLARNFASVHTSVPICSSWK